MAGQRPLRSLLRSTRRRRSAPASIPRPAAACLPWTDWRGAVAFTGHWISGPEAASWRLPPRSACVARSSLATSIRKLCASRGIMPAATASPPERASSERKFHLWGAQPDGGLARLHRLVPGLLVETLDDRPDLGAADADIGKRIIVERHQLVIGALAIPPALPGITRSDEKIDQRHHRLLTTRMVHCKNGNRCTAEPSKKAHSSHA